MSVTSDTPAEEQVPLLDTSSVMLELYCADCLQRLAVTTFGRVVITGRHDTPVIRPVNYHFDAPSQSVVFATGRGSQLDALLASHTAVFEIDGIDPERHTGWSVIVSGITEKVTEPGEIARLTQTGPEPWAPGNKHHLIRIRAFTVSGRRITLTPPGPD